MKRTCSHCQRPFTPQDFVKEDSRGMEAERRALGLEGVRFLYYACPACSYADIFLDIFPLEGESPEAFRGRKAELEATVNQLHDEQHAEQVEVVLVEKGPR